MKTLATVIRFAVADRPAARVKRQVARLEPSIPFINGYIPLAGTCWKCGSTRIRTQGNGLSYCMECRGPQG